ncbi:tape measure protein [Desulfobulbus sp.]|uniref:tape measure protein n=1 Tax=Desulfobulbus sp. TaxID=895 RepID=UPI00286EF475|nr:tape measure protein [Desulfobulbus sp.]
MSSQSQSKIEIVLSAVDRGLTTGFQRATAQLKAFFTGSKQVESGLTNVGRSVAGMVASLGATVSAAAGIQKLVGVSREFDKLNAGLITATGSAEGADRAFVAIQDFATKTPYDLAGVTDSFIKLVNFGLDPSERALTSYGNTSSALGKDLNQMIEAVADAATFEFERLKEFGIKARQEGDKVSFTFRGVTTTVGKNAREIEEYLIKLGEVNFGDAMSNRMATLDGALSNLGDEWDKVFLNISQAGIGDIIADSVRTAIGALEELNAQIASGELEGNLRATGVQFSGWADDARAAVAIVIGEMHQLEVNGQDSVNFLIDAFRRFPENVRAFIGLMTVNVAAGLDKVTAYARAFKNGVAAIFNDQSFAGIGAQLELELQNIDTAREASSNAILDQREATIKASDEEREKARQLRTEYNAQQKAAAANTSDRLAQFRVQAAGAQESAKSSKEAAAAAKKAAAEAKKLYEEQKKIAEAKMRAASQEKILAMEMEKIEASKLPSKLVRAEAELAIERRIMAERVSLKRQELAAIKADPNANQADVIRAESDLAALLVQNETQLNDRLRDLANTRMDDVEKSWRRGIVSAQEYQAAVRAALALGTIDEDEARTKLIGAGDDMGAAFGEGIRQARERMESDGEMMISIGADIADQISGGLVSAWDGFIMGTESAGEALSNFARSTISWLSQVILKQLLMNALMGATGGGSGGSGGLFAMMGFADGAVQGLAGGGSVGGWSSSRTADNIPIWATAGEFMQPVRAVEYYGVNFMERLRRLEFPRHIAHALAGGTVPTVPSGFRLAQGGMPAAEPQTTVKAGDVNLRIVNVNDRNQVGDYMRSADGETVLLNMIRRNGSTIRTLIGG